MEFVRGRFSNALKVCACMKWCLAFFAIATTPEIGFFGPQQRRCPGAGEMPRPSATSDPNRECQWDAVAQREGASSVRSHSTR